MERLVKDRKEAVFSKLTSALLCNCASFKYSEVGLAAGFENDVITSTSLCVIHAFLLLFFLNAFNRMLKSFL